MDRKKDTRRKIQMGGLVITSKLDHLFDSDQAILLGLLLEAREQVGKSPTIISKWQNIGREYFRENFSKQ